MESSVGAKTVLAMRSQNRQNKAPPRKQAGITKIGFDVFRRDFARCGTAIPTKEIGPAKAVTQADKTLESKIKRTGQTDWTAIWSSGHRNWKPI